MHGGAVYLGLHGVLDISDSVFEANLATSGGGLYAVTPTLMLKDSDFSSNQAFQSGGAVFVSMGEVSTSFQNITFR